MGCGRDLRSRLERYERRLILAALAGTGGNQARAARDLGVLPTTLHEKMKRLDIHLVPVVRQLDEPDPRERSRLQAALAESGGEVARAAAALNLSPSDFRERLALHRLAVVRLPAPPPPPPGTARELPRHRA